MTEQEIKQAIEETTKGANIYLEWERPVKLRKAYKGLPFTKWTKMLCRIGVNYDNKKTTQEGRENGDLPAENAGLRGFEWEQFPTILRSIKTEKLYLRLEGGTFKTSTKREYRLDGQVVEFEQYKEMMLASEYKPKPPSPTFNVGFDAIQSIHTYKPQKEAVTA